MVRDCVKPAPPAPDTDPGDNDPGALPKPPLPKRSARLSKLRATSASASEPVPPGAGDLAAVRLPDADASKLSACPASVPCMPAARGAAMRPAMPSSACSATVRPKRASHAAGIGSSFTIVPTATPSPIVAPSASDSTTSKVSGSSSWLSLKMRMYTCFEVWPG